MIELGRFDTIEQAEEAIASMKKQAPGYARRKKEKATVRPIGLSKGNLGAASQQMIAARMMLAGVQVFVPMNEDTPIDLLAMTPAGRFLKCQCKTIFYDRRVDLFVMNLCTVRKSGPGSKARRHVYTEHEVDVFIGYCHFDDSVYVIPFKAAEGRASLSFKMASGNCVPRWGKSADPTPFRGAFGIFK